MHLVDEEHRLNALINERATSSIDNRTHFLHPGIKRGKRFKVSTGRRGNQTGKSSLASSRRAKQNNGGVAATLDQTAQRCSGC